MSNDNTFIVNMLGKGASFEVEVHARDPFEAKRIAEAQYPGYQAQNARSAQQWRTDSDDPTRSRYS